MALIKRFVLVHQQARSNAAAFCHEAPEGSVVDVKEPNRNLEQNALSWVILQAFSEQLLWPVNGIMEKLTPGEFKDVLTAAFKKETSPRLASGLDGGVVMLGVRTSKMSKREFSEWLEFLHAVAAIKGVKL